MIAQGQPFARVRLVVAARYRGKAFVESRDVMLGVPVAREVLPRVLIEISDRCALTPGSESSRRTQGQ